MIEGNKLRSWQWSARSPGAKHQFPAVNVFNLHNQANTAQTVNPDLTIAASLVIQGALTTPSGSESHHVTPNSECEERGRPDHSPATDSQGLTGTRTSGVMHFHQNPKTPDRWSDRESNLPTWSSDTQIGGPANPSTYAPMTLREPRFPWHLPWRSDKFTRHVQKSA